MKRGGMCVRRGRGGKSGLERERDREDRQVTESSFTPFDSFAVRDTYALVASSYARTHARTYDLWLFVAASLPCMQVPPDMAVKVLFTRLLLALKSAVNTGRRRICNYDDKI